MRVLLGLLITAVPLACQTSGDSNTPAAVAWAFDRVPTAGNEVPSHADGPLLPLIDYHRHLQSPTAAQRWVEPPLPVVDLPEELDALVEKRTERWNDSAGLAQLYTEDSVLLDASGPHWIRGRGAVASRLAGYFNAPYRVTPVAWSVTGASGYIAGYFTRDDAGSTRYLGHVHLSLERGDNGAWQIAAETPVFDGPLIRPPQPVTAKQLVAQFDAAGIRRAVVLSLAYWFGSPRGVSVDDEYALVRAENDWTAAEASQFPDRLIAFCSFNPLKDYALEELERCAAHPHLVGLKLHFANSGVDVRDSAHVEKLQRVFRAANSHGLPVVVHLWVPDWTYGAEHSKIFLDRVLPEAPDVVVQIAHFAGGGAGYTEDALDVFAQAISDGDPRTRNVYFDVAAVVDGDQSAERPQRLAMRIREVGLDRVLFGSDMAPPPAWQPWMEFRMNVPLTEPEFRAIATNIAPYMH